MYVSSAHARAPEVLIEPLNEAYLAEEPEVIEPETTKNSSLLAEL